MNVDHWKVRVERSRVESFLVERWIVEVKKLERIKYINFCKLVLENITQIYLLSIVFF